MPDHVNAIISRGVVSVLMPTAGVATLTVFAMLMLKEIGRHTTSPAAGRSVERSVGSGSSIGWSIGYSGCRSSTRAAVDRVLGLSIGYSGCRSGTRAIDKLLGRSGVR